MTEQENIAQELGHITLRLDLLQERAGERVCRGSLEDMGGLVGLMGKEIERLKDLKTRILNLDPFIPA